MAVSTSIRVMLAALESQANDLGQATQRHLAEYPGNLGSGEYDSGTTDNKFDLVWSDTRTLAATSESLDLVGILTAALGGAAISFVEIGAIYIKNRATTAGHVLIIGNAASPMVSGLFNASADRLKVPASGCFLWFAPLDGGGAIPTAGTNDLLKIDAGANTITYDILVLGRSA